MEEEIDLLDKSGRKVVTPGYMLEKIYNKIDTGSDVIINSISSKDLIVGRPIKVDGKTIVVSTGSGSVTIKISDILDLN